MSKNILKKFGFVDFVIIIGVIIALMIGVCTAKHFRQTADKQIEATSPITFQVFLRGVTVTGQDFPIVKGDSKSMSIAAASILAKVTRDRLCADFDVAYPEYGIAKHKGYPTKDHMEAVRLHGPSPIHRRSFLKFLEK